MFEDTKAKILKAKEKHGRQMLAKKPSRLSKKTSLMLTGSRQGSHQSSNNGQIASAGGPGSKGPRVPAIQKLGSNSPTDGRSVDQSPKISTRMKKSPKTQSAIKQGTSTAQNNQGIRLVDQKNPSQESIIRINDRDEDWLQDRSFE